MAEDVEVRWLQDGAKFIEMLARDAWGKHVDLDVWQMNYIRDDSSFINVLKSRRAGFSWIEAAKGIFRSQTVIRPTMGAYVYEKFFISRNLEESKEKITLARHLYDMFPSKYKLQVVSDAKTELVFVDSRGRQSRLKALTAQEPRGPGGDINIDEAAHIKNVKQIYQSALYMTESGGQLSIGSTPAGQSGLFYDIATNARGPDGELLYPNFKRYRVEWWLSHRLCTDVLRASIEAPKMTTVERVKRFGTPRLQNIFRATTLENFIRECECGFMDEKFAFMPYELIWSCEEDRYSEDPADAEATYFFEHFHNTGLQKEPTEQFWKLLRQMKKGYLEIGVDIGRKKDMTAIVVSDEVNGVWNDRAIVRLDTTPFPVQKKILEDAIRITQPGAVRIDNNGLGMQLAEELVGKFGPVVVPVNFTNNSKAKMANTLKIAFQNKTTRIPKHGEYIDHLHSIQQTLTGTNLFQYEAESSDHHGDFFWAKALTMYRESQVIEEFNPAFGRSKRIGRTPLDD